MNNTIKTKIEYINKSIMFQTNDESMYCALKEEYSKYLRFSEQYNINDELIKFKVLKDKIIYNKYLTQMINHHKPKFKNFYIGIRRENVIIVDKEKKEVTMIYDTYKDEKLQHAEEIMLGLLGKLIENDGYFFIHAACVSKNGKGIVLFGNRNIGKTSLMLEFIQNSFDFVNNSQLGINGTRGISIPTRIGVRQECLYNGVIKEEYINKIKKTDGYFYGIEKNEELKTKNDLNEKFNLTVKDISEIFKVNTIHETEINIMIEPHYLPGIKKIKVEEMSKEELINKIMDNRRSGIYNSVSYIEILFENNKNIKLLDILRRINIKGYKIFQSQVNELELMKYVSEKLDEK